MSGVEPVGEYPTMTSAHLRPAEYPTLYFIGVTTGRSSIQRVFPLWAETLGLTNAVLQGIDLPLHADPAEYRRVVEFIAADPLSLGALVTTHKIDLFQATADLFDVIDPLASLMGETSCISKSGQGLVSHAKDPVSSGLTLEAQVPSGHWETTGADVVSMGAGGSSIAIGWHLSRPSRGADRPNRIVVTDRSEARLEHFRRLETSLATDTRFEYVLASQPEDNDRAVAESARGSLIINATGLGKDAPGSPTSPAVAFPLDGLAWELNYRGDLVFLEQARAQEAQRHLTVSDGWLYFLHGWTQVIGEVFHVAIPTSGPTFETLSDLAKATR